jgi:hypothetical protein
MTPMTASRSVCALACLFLGVAAVRAEGDFPPLLSPAVSPGSPTPMVQTPEPFWVRAEYLMWRFKPVQVHVPLVTTGDITSATGGFLGDPSTVILFGPNSTSYDWLTGGRLTVGMNLVPDGFMGVEVTGFGIERGHIQTNIGTDAVGNPPLLLVFNATVPFFGIVGENGVLFTTPVALGGPGPGGMAIGADSTLWGVEANGSILFWQHRCETACVQLLAGVRYLDLDEKFQIDAQAAAAGAGTHDRFHTRNQYLGIQGGVRGGFTFCDDWTIEVMGKVALGSMRQTLDIAGESYSPAGVLMGGFYALPPNIGRSSRDTFAVVPELGVRLSYHPLQHCRIFAGYDFLYLSNVIRASEEINRNLNGTLIPLVAQSLIADNSPTRLFADTTFWAHGLNVGFEYRF